MDIEEFFKDDLLDGEVSWDPKPTVEEWIPCGDIDRAESDTTTTVGMVTYRGTCYGRCSYGNAYIIRQSHLLDLVERDLSWACGSREVSLADLMIDYVEIMRSNVAKPPRVLFHFEGNVRAIVLRLMQPVRYVLLESWNMHDFMVRRGIGMPMEKMKRMVQVRVGSIRYSIHIVAVAEVSSDCGHDTLPPKVMDVLESYVSKDYYQLFVKGNPNCVMRMDGLPVWVSRAFSTYDDGYIVQSPIEFVQLGAVRVAIIAKECLPEGMIADGAEKWAVPEVRTFLQQLPVKEPEIVWSDNEVVVPPTNTSITVKIGGKGMGKKGKAGVKQKKKRDNSAFLRDQDNRDIDLWQRLKEATRETVGSLGAIETYQGDQFIAYSRDHARVNMEKVREVLRGIVDLLGSLFVIAPGDGIGIASRVCAEMGINGAFGDQESSLFTATNVHKESFVETIKRGQNACGCSLCQRWDSQCEACQKSPTPIILLSYVTVFMQDRACWTVISQSCIPTIIIDSPYRIPYARAMRKQAGVWVVNFNYPEKKLWSDWNAPIVTHPRGYFVPFTNALVEPRRWGFLDDTASLLYLASIYPGSQVSNYSKMTDDQVRDFLGNIGLRFVERSDADIIIVSQEHDDDFGGRWRLDLRTGHYSRGEAYVPFDVTALPSQRSLHRGSIYVAEAEIVGVIGPVNYARVEKDRGCVKTIFWSADLRGQTRVTVTFRNSSIFSRVQLTFHGD